MRTARIWRVPAGLIAVLLVLHLLGETAFAALVYDRDHILSGEFWRLLSGHFVHWNATHLAMNVAALGLWVLLCARAWSATTWLAYLVVLAAAVSGGMWFFWPETWRYAGLSGLAHGLFVLGLAPMARRGDWLAIACLLYIVFKVSFEQWQGMPLTGGGTIGVRVATEAHLLGTVAACALVLGQWLWCRLRAGIADRSGSRHSNSRH